ncbi:MAG: VCBS repeat-containing protein [Bacteroidia bacterium]|nr:VCBS repeat-containing protein [Bacteroidia bacterium]
MKNLRFMPILMSLFALVLISCKKDTETQISEDKTLFTSLSSDYTGVDFINAVENQKDFNIFKYRNFYNGGGVALGDINNDGLDDIYLTGNMEANKLYLNKGNFKFEDISASAGVEGSKPWSTGVVMVDINSDGLLDIYVSNAGNMEGNNHNNDLYINNGDLTFSEKAEEYNLAETGFSTHASFFDYDKDGDLDAYILNNSNIPVTSLGYAEQRDLRAKNWNVPHAFKGVGDMLMRNDNGKFVDVSEDAGIYGSLIGFGLGIMITDINNDLYPDIYVSNDFYERDYLYINNQDGTFSEDIKNWTEHLCLSAMGIDVADINNDGLQDIFITDMLPDGDERVKSVMEFDGYNVFKLKQSKDFYQQYIQNTLQVNNGNGTFSEIAYYSDVSATDWSWSGLMFDMDNDGYRDIFVTNGINHDLTDLDFVDFFANEIIQKMAVTGKKESIDSIIAKMPVVPIPNYAFHNQKELKFKNMAEEWGLGVPGLSNGAAYGDLDNDGDLDLVVNNVNMESFIYRNNANELTDNNYIKFKFKGAQSNPFAIGTKVVLFVEDQEIMQELIPSRGFQSSMSYDMVIGMGTHKKIDSIRVIWPDNRLTKIDSQAINQVLNFDIEQADSVFELKPETTKKTLFAEVSQDLPAHTENAYNDFDIEGLIEKQLSQEGPAFATGDIDGDGNDDLFLGGSAGKSGVLLKYQNEGEFKEVKISVFDEFIYLEETAAAFFDADGDKDMDLLIASGGNQVNQKGAFLNRLYLNDGMGNFELSSQTLPSTNDNVSVVAPNDFDQDGDLDVFIGSRSVVGVYGINPEHLMLENLGNGEFKDVTERVAFDIKDAGMITDALWKDADSDGIDDLITVSDWGTPKIFKNNGRRLSSMSTNLDELHGWWLTLEAEDIDNDGDIDFIFGNQGENIHYIPSEENVMKLWVNDFDNNGTIEQIMTQTVDGKDKPLHQKKEIVNQMVSLKKRNLKASEYARKAIDELFDESIINNTLVKKAKYSSSLIAINNNGSYEFKKLPPRAQFSCVCDISCVDVNNDGHKDLVVAGNNFEFKPQYSRLDANYGTVLLNDGNSNFKWENYDRSGFFVRGEVKHLDVIEDNQGNKFMVVAINDQSPKVFSIDAR